MRIPYLLDKAKWYIGTKSISILRCKKTKIKNNTFELNILISSIQIKMAHFGLINLFHCSIKTKMVTSLCLFFFSSSSRDFVDDGVSGDDDDVTCVLKE